MGTSGLARMWGGCVRENVRSDRGLWMSRVPDVGAVEAEVVRLGPEAGVCVEVWVDGEGEK